MGEVIESTQEAAAVMRHLSSVEAAIHQCPVRRLQRSEISMLETGERKEMNLQELHASARATIDLEAMGRVARALATWNLARLLAPYLGAKP